MELTTDEVKARVYSYQDEKITAELYAFGMMLLSEIQQRAAQLDSKSAVVLGWATGILAFVFFANNKIAPSLPARFATATGAFALLAVVFSFFALRTRDEWGWPTDESWFCSTALTSADELKRYYIRVMHDVRQTHLAATKRKARRLSYAEAFLALAALFLFVGSIGQFTS
jgi:hypothetical protein